MIYTSMYKILENRGIYSQWGVSLVELSIVIVIIGLILGAVAGGISIRKAAELRSIITEYDRLQVAFSGFEDKYRDLPGDMPDAHDYWDDGVDGVCGTAAQCNGDGDGTIDLGSDDDEREVWRLWQHLSLAGFIEGTYTGIGGAGLDLGKSLMSKFSNAGFHSEHRNGGAYSFGRSGNILELAKANTVANSWTGILSVIQAKTIDNKMDDGIANKGRLYGIDGNGVTDTDCSKVGTDSSGLDYNLDSTVEEACILIFWLDNAT